MMRRFAGIAATALLAHLAAGCASPPPKFYTLSPTVPVTATANTSNLAIVVGPISIPAVVDVPEIVVTRAANQVSLDEFHRWASPLRNNIAQVVTANLAVILGTSRVSPILSLDADFRVIIDVQTFESTPGDAATLSAVWLVRRIKDGKTETGRTSVRESTAGQDYAALAGAHSRALNRLSQDVANAIRALESAPP